MADYGGNMLLLTFLSLVLKVHAAWYSVEPQPTSVLLGGSVTIFCAFDGINKNDAVHWFGPPNLHFISEGTSVSEKYPRVFVSGQGNSGDNTGVYNLNIRDVRMEDEGVYRCSTFSLKEPEDVKLTVIVPPPRPPIIMGDRSPREEGGSLHLTCRSEGGRPLPSLAWYNGTRRYSHLTSTGVVSNDNLLNVVEQTLDVPYLGKWDNGANFSCVADQGLPNLLPPKTTSILFQVLYSPTVFVPRTYFKVREGESANLTCLTNGNPIPEVTWRKTSASGVQRRVNDVRGQSNVIQPVSRLDAGTYQCKADNGIQPVDTASIKLDVLYPPSIRPTFDEKVNVLYDNEEEFFLECKADGNPTPRVRWRRKNTDLYFSNPLRFSRLDYQTEGTYECVADSSIFPQDVKDAVIDVIGKPDIRGDPETAHATQGSSVTLLCEVTSDPSPGSIIWYWRSVDGQEIELTKGSIDGLTVRQKTTDSYTESLLILDHVSSGSSGDYICKAINMFGSDTREYRVIVSGPPVIMIAIVTGVLVVSILLTLVAVIFIIRRRDVICGNRSHVKECKESQPTHLNIEPCDVELDNVECTTKPIPPPRPDKDPYAIGISYPRLGAHVRAPEYSTADRRKQAECKHPSPHRHRHKKYHHRNDHVGRVERDYQVQRWEVVSKTKDLQPYGDVFVGEGSMDIPDRRDF
ncbi:hemicentin-2-like isoform X1 [Branchiostoma floridae]|uniref:Hemicentin-2-like isoform X1 n=1 Tax=Branchiostoma floridae TaxID=7739 RepID=A0A9J7LMX4_BRAFL|nr:hemicentin-2-like isoform X1 [Branchiostoma floridae]